ncbi:MAG TPA: SH3 domain-containing protein, partial [Thermoanaerobaculia bacterium]|nr:SH3 domain-containing protein [Thermoanaerobaculia bacterium]
MRRLANLAAALGLLALAAAPAVAQEAAQEAEEQPELLGAPATFGDALAEERIEVAAGSALRELPDHRAAVLATVDAASELPLLERRGAWARVRYGALKGWVLAEGEAGAGGSPGVVAAGPAALPGREADPELLGRALRHLEWPAGREPGRLGPFPFYTDLADPALASFLDRVVREVLAVYPERF